MTSTASISPSFIPYGRHSINERDIEAVVEVLRQGPLTQGPLIEAFERKIAEYVGARHAVAVSSGTSALHLACLSAGFKAGERVLVTPNTFVASANAILYAGAQPAFIDIHPESLLWDSSKLIDTCRQSPNIKGLLPVHFGGLTCDMDAIHEAAAVNDAVVIEDAAHALGAVYSNGGRVGNCSHSAMTIFSFHPVKLIAAGEGGVITTNSDLYAARLRRLRSHGISKEKGSFQNSDQAFTNGRVNPWYYEMQELGFNYRLTDIQAALALSQMNRMDEFLSRRRQLVARYDQGLKDLPFLSRPRGQANLSSAHHVYVVRVDFAKAGQTREEVMDRLYRLGIGTQVHYIPVYRQPYYASMGFQPSDYPEMEKYYAEALTLPLYPDLKDSDQDRVIEALSTVLR